MKLDCIRDLIPDTIFFYNKGRMLIQGRNGLNALPEYWSEAPYF